MYVYQYYKIEKTAHPFSITLQIALQPLCERRHCAQSGNAFRNTHHILQLFRTLPGMKTVSGCEAAFATTVEAALEVKACR